MNSRLRSFGYGHITPSTIKMLNRLCCDALFAAGKRAGRAEAMRAVRDTVSSHSVDAASLESNEVASLESGEVVEYNGHSNDGGDPDWYPEQNRVMAWRCPFNILAESEDESLVTTRAVNVTAHEAGPV